MSRSMKEIVFMLELAAENNWVETFYTPFGEIECFRPLMGIYPQVLTCAMNIR